MQPSRKWFRGSNAVAALVFALFAVVQVNDPDPLMWVVVYGVTSVLCGLAAVGRLPAFMAASWAGVLAAGAAFVAATANGEINPMPGFSQDSWMADEEVREALGLGLAAAWLLLDFVLLALVIRGEDPLAQPDRRSD